MTDHDIRRASLADLKKMKERGELLHNPDAPESEELGADFWDKAEIVERQKPRSVHLKLDPDVFDYFYTETNGKGHLTRMQNVLRAYVRARSTAGS